MKKNFVQPIAMPVGMVCLVIAIILSRYVAATKLVDFITGFLYGISIVLNLYYIYTVARNKRKSISKNL